MGEHLRNLYFQGELQMLGTLQQHIAKAENDVKFTQKIIDSGEYLEWSIVSLFYFALHCINGHAANMDRNEFEKPKYSDHDEHVKRIRYAQRNIGRPFAKIYKKLYDRSRQCRYDATYYRNVKKARVQDYYKETIETCVACRLFPEVRL